MDELEAAWQRSLAQYVDAGYHRGDVGDWERMFWEAGYKQALRESGGSR